MRFSLFLKSRLFAASLLSLGLLTSFYGKASVDCQITHCPSPWQIVLPAAAQSLRPEGAAYIIYQRLSFVPLENQYRRQDTGEIDKNHTLISRLIRYNEDVKKRSSYRFDWQLTFADYLGANETIDIDRYPGNTTLQTNPAKADIAIINKFTLAQRQALITLLAELYAPPQAPSSTPQRPATNASPPPTTKPSRPGLTKPGDANLLLSP